MGLNVSLPRHTTANDEQTAGPINGKMQQRQLTPTISRDGSESALDVKRPTAVPWIHLGLPAPPAHDADPTDQTNPATTGIPPEHTPPPLARSTLAAVPAEIIASFLLYLPASCVLVDASRTCRAWLSVVRRHGELRGHAALCGLHVLGGVSHSMGSIGAVPLRVTVSQSRCHGAADWEAKIPPMQRERVHCAVATVSRRIYVVGGRSNCERLRSAEVFDPSNHAWVALPPMTHVRSGAAAVGHGGKLWVFGGTDGNGDVGVVSTFDPALGAWSDGPVPSMPYPASEVAAVACGRLILVVGGRQRDGTALGVVRCLDPAARTWSELPPMLTARAGPAVGVVDGTLWVAGGSDMGRAPLATTEALALDVATPSWAMGPIMSTPRSNPAGAVVRGQFRVMCGFCLGPLSTAEALCPTTRQWKRCKDVPRKFDAARAVVWE